MHSIEVSHLTGNYALFYLVSSITLPGWGRGFEAGSMSMSGRDIILVYGGQWAMQFHQLHHHGLLLRKRSFVKAEAV